MGPNGAGKSTLSAVVMGKPGYEVLGGSVTLDGVDVLALPAWQRAQAGLHLVMQYPSEVAGVSLDARAWRRRCVARGRSTDGLDALLEAEAQRIGLSPELLAPVAQRRPLRRREEAQRDAAARRAASRGSRSSTSSTPGSTSTRCATAPAGSRTSPTSARLGALVITHYNRLLEALHPDVIHILVKGRIVAERRTRAGRRARARRLRRVHARRRRGRRARTLERTRRPLRASALRRIRRGDTRAGEIVRSWRTRSSVAGWVENSRAVLCARPPRASASGLWM